MMSLPVQTERIRIRAGSAEMEGTLRLPETRIGTVLFAHGGVSNRLSPSNDYVGSVLCAAKFATLWIDLLTPHEMRNWHARFDIALLTARLDAACDWLLAHESTRDLPLGLLGAGHASAAALRSAAARGNGISGIVSRGGRPDLAGQQALIRITAPTLLIVGGLDEAVVQLNRTAYASLRCKKRLEIIPGATPAFEEPGNLEVVARFARSWFQTHSHSRTSSLHV